MRKHRERMTRHEKMVREAEALATTKWGDCVDRHTLIAKKKCASGVEQTFKVSAWYTPDLLIELVYDLRDAGWTVVVTKDVDVQVL